MKIKGKYILREVAGENIAVPVSGTVLTSNIIIVLNETGKFLWTLFEEGGTEDEFAEALYNEYETSKEKALSDVRKFIEYLKSNKVEIE